MTETGATSEARAARLVADLIKFPTVNPPGNEAKCARFILESLQSMDVEARLVPHPFPDRPQVLGVLGSGSSPVLALNGHMDVVPEGEPEEWSHPPFAGELVDGLVYGRGADDMKGGLAAMLLAAEALATESRSWRGTLVLQFAIGEETGEPGTLELLKEPPRPDFGIVLEASEFMVSVAARGLTWWELTAHGVSAHAGNPVGAVNAIDAVTGLLANVARYAEELTHRAPHPLLGAPSCTVTMIDGGTKENVVPDRCRVILDRRLIPGEKVADVESEVRGLWPTHLATRNETSCRQVYEPGEIDPDHELVNRLRASTKRITGRDPGIHAEAAATDARNFINDFGIPAVIWGPGTLDGSHVVDECIAAEEISVAAEVLVDLCRDWLA